MTFLAAAPILPVPGSGRVDWVLIVVSIAILAVGIAAFLVWSNRSSRPQATVNPGPTRTATQPGVDNQRRAA